MTQVLFEKQLRERIRRKPFEPFEVIVDDGRAIFVDEPAIAFGGGRAGFIGPDGLVEFFDCEHVVEFRRPKVEPAS
jgi:hypothetical protein